MTVGYNLQLGFSTSGLLPFGAKQLFSQGPSCTLQDVQQQLWPLPIRCYQQLPTAVVLPKISPNIASVSQGEQNCPQLRTTDSLYFFPVLKEILIILFLVLTDYLIIEARCIDIHTQGRGIPLSPACAIWGNVPRGVFSIVMEAGEATVALASQKPGSCFLVLPQRRLCQP